MPTLPLKVVQDRNGVRHTRNWTLYYSGTQWKEETPVFSYDRIRSSYSVERQSVNTPGFRNRAKNHTMPVNNFYYKKSTTKSAVGAVSSYNVPSGHVVQYHVGCMERTTMDIACPTVGAVSTSEKSSIDRQARTKVLLKLKDEKTNVGNFIGERKQAGKMFIDNVTRMAGAITHLKKGDIIGAAGALGVSIKSNRAKKRFGRSFKRDQATAIANGWLELQFGIKPLLDDIKGAAESLARSNLNIIEGRVSATVKRQASKQSSIKSTDYWQNTYYDNAKTDYHVKYVVRYSVDLKLSHNLTSLGLTNPMGIGWELTPFSFIVDWVLPIGDFISTLDATVGLSFQSGSVTTFENTQISRRAMANGTLTSGNLRHYFDTSSFYDMVECRRSLLTGFPEVAFPVFKNPMTQDSTSHHIGIVIALITQAMGKTPSRM